MPTNEPATIWLMRSPRKLRSVRGLNCCETSCSDTTVSENVSPATVISAVAIVERMLRAVEASPVKPARPSAPPSARSSQVTRNESAMKQATIAPGRKTKP